MIDSATSLLSRLCEECKTSRKYPTRLRDGKIEKGHDDWDCLYDLEEAKLIVAQGTGVHPVLAMTEAGTRLVEMIRRHKSAGGSFSNFVVASEVVLAQGS